MLVSTRGIVLHKIKYSDSSLIVKVFTRAAGVQSFMVKNAFSKKNKAQLALLENLSMLEITFDDKNGNIKFFKEISLYYAYGAIPFDVVRSSLLVFYNELIYKLLRDYQTDEALYDFIENALLELDAPDARLVDIHLRFMVSLSKLMGFNPTNNFAETTPYFSIEDARFVTEWFDYPNYLSYDASHYLYNLLNDASLQIIPTKPVRNELLHGLIAYFILHNEQIHQIDSVAILAELLS